jgi:hypothetical protein
MGGIELVNFSGSAFAGVCAGRWYEGGECIDKLPDLVRLEIGGRDANSWR